MLPLVSKPFKPLTREVLASGDSKVPSLKITATTNKICSRTKLGNLKNYKKTYYEKIILRLKINYCQ